MLAAMSLEQYELNNVLHVVRCGLNNCKHVRICWVQSEWEVVWVGFGMRAMESSGYGGLPGSPGAGAAATGIRHSWRAPEIEEMAGAMA